MLVLGALLVLQLADSARSAKPVRAVGGVASLIARARVARYQQDSALASYRAIARQRISVGFGIARGLVGPVGRERLAARIESVARVGWHHEFGVWGEVLGARGVAPIAGEYELDTQEHSIALPYYPGRERLWPVSEIRLVPIAGDWIVHPLDAGVDSVYEFSRGDSLRIDLPDGGNVSVLEIRVRAKRPDPHLVVGSLWVDVATGNLVRAAYRPSVSMDLWPLLQRELKNKTHEDKFKKLGPFNATIREIVIEHGLYEQRFWLPRTQLAFAEGTAKGARLTLSIEQTFRYEDVTALEPGRRSRAADETEKDPRTGRVRLERWSGLVTRSSRCREHGDTSHEARWSPDSLIRDDRLSIVYVNGIRFRVLLPCDSRDMLHSPELPASIYDPGEELFTDTDLGALRKDVENALGISSQAKWQPLPATVHYGLTGGLLRYNRVEGLSPGVRVEQVLGKGYTASAAARLGLADLQPNAELSMQRSNVRTAWAATAYRRLAATNDWGDPFGLGASAMAALFARDDGFYYRTAGGEFTLSHRRIGESLVLSLRFFAERHDVARVETQQSLAHLVSGTAFQSNILARSGEYAGGTGALGYAWGSNPRGTRLFGALRAEGAGGEVEYGRFLMEHTINQGLLAGVQATLTGAAGSSVGELPPQRFWYVGGPFTVRGYRAAELAGDAFWLGRAELSIGHPLLRPAVFGDIAWAGDRRDWRRPGRPLRGVGVGASAMDGLIRAEVSRGLDRERLWRVDVYLDVR